MASTNNEGERYDVLDKIGHGSFGIIRKVKRKSDGMVLCRKEIQYIRMSQKEREQLHAEFSILSSLRHPNIVAYYHRDHLKVNQELHLYMEYCGGGDLSKVIRGLKEQRQFAEEAYVWSIFSQLVTALYRCHYGEDPPEVGNVMSPPNGKGKPTSGLRKKSQVMILHRDLKPENVFLGEDNAVKLGDFGLSKLMQSHDFASTYVGTPFYMSPEICAAERYTLHSDIWSLGCIIYELCQREPPFNAKTHFHLVQKIKDGRYEPLPTMYSPELQKLVSSCLNVNPLRRPDTWDLLQLPVVRLLRKEREVVDLGRVLKARDEDLQRKSKEMEVVVSRLAKEKRESRVEMEGAVRREWEVKARLEIDRQVAMEKERLQQLMEIELQVRSRTETERLNRVKQARESDSRRTSSNSNHEATSPTSQPVPGLSSISTAASTDGPLTDLSTLSMDSPATATVPILPTKRSARTPFSRARTQIDSPMDIAMASPSPMSIASLSLSPRRAAALSQGIAANSGNLFVAANKVGRQRWQPQLMSPVSSDDEEAGAHSPNEDDDDVLLALPSPTRMPRAASGDPFKAGPRPGLVRQNTAPTKRQQVPRAALFSGGKDSPTSPTRQRAPPRPVLGKAFTTMGGTSGGDEMLKAVVAKNMTTANNQNAGFSGRTLVELQQARVGERQTEPASWDPEMEEMPSPFLTRVKRGVAMTR